MLKCLAQDVPATLRQPTDLFTDAQVWGRGLKQALLRLVDSLLASGLILARWVIDQIGLARQQVD